MILLWKVKAVCARLLSLVFHEVLEVFVIINIDFIKLRLVNQGN